MTIQPKQSSFIVHCDTCTAYIEVDSPDVKDLMKAIKFRGWNTYEERNCDKSGKWSHKCPVCEEGK